MTRRRADQGGEKLLVEDVMEEECIHIHILYIIIAAVVADVVITK